MPSLFNLQRCSLATVLEDSQFQRALARHAQRCSRFAVTLVADSMDTSGLTARDYRSARARPRAGRGALVGRLPLARPQHGQVQRGLGPGVATVSRSPSRRHARRRLDGRVGPHRPGFSIGTRSAETL